LCNYRPISILCNFSKIFESLIFKRVKNYFDHFRLLSENQFGFWKNKSTELASINFLKYILPAVTQNSFCICVFLDFSACFDTISREILLKKLERYGVRGKSLELITTYFANRLQYVSFMGSQSKRMSQELGVIQGSKTLPLFYDIYSNDINQLLMDTNHVLFADDTAIVMLGDNLNDLTDLVNSKLNDINDWCKFNKISLNPKKSEFMLISNKRVNNHPVIRIGNELVKCVESFKYLGIHIDRSLKFHSHIDELTSKLRNLKGVTYRLRYYLNLSSSFKLYYAMVYSHMQYGIAVWGGNLATQQYGNDLIKLHEKIVKNLFSHHFPYSRCLYKAAKILKPKDIHFFAVCIYMFKIIKLEHISLQSTINVVRPSHNYLTRNRDKFILPFPRVNSIKISYNYQFIKIWNELPNELKELRTINMFKTHLKSYILNSY